MKQISFASAKFNAKKRLLRGKKFLGLMSQVAPFAELESPFEPHYPGSGRLSR
ncbi:MAG: hypothetical protein HQ446_13820 [Polaromonas sp.]|nr:hypothetical protein [Polaromonas sp.]